jgi:hypothetical protein
MAMSVTFGTTLDRPQDCEYDRYDHDDNQDDNQKVEHASWP